MPYDAGSLPTAVIDEARRNHPTVVEDGAAVASADYVPDAIARAFDAPLAPPEGIPVEMRFSGEGELHALQAVVWAQASQRGVASERISDLVLAVDETVTNSILYGGGGGVLPAWSQDGEMIFEVGDQGLIDQPLVGRLTPDPNEPGWIRTLVGEPALRSRTDPIVAPRFAGSAPRRDHVSARRYGNGTGRILSGPARPTTPR